MGNGQSTSDDVLSSYSQLINMGFEDNDSLKAATMYPKNVNKAITYIIHQQLQIQTEADGKKNANNHESKTDEPNEKQIQQFKEGCLYKCDSVSKCMSLKRTISILKLYKHNHSADNKILCNSLIDCKHLIINDYHHILDHLNEDSVSINKCSETFKIIYNEIIKTHNLQCDINSCEIYLRSNRMREKQTVKCANKHFTVYMDILDSIHCYLIHSVDMGYRIIHDFQSEKSISALKSYLNKKRKNLEKIRGESRLQNNKFVTKIKSNTNPKKNADHGLNLKQYQDEEKIDPAEDKQYSFGQMYNCWDGISHQAKYKSFKFELLNNELLVIDIDKFNDIYEQSNALLIDSHKLKTIKSVYIPKYKFKAGLPLKICNVISVKLYTDFDTLSYSLTKTFRGIYAAKRNAEYWWWTKLLSETVNCFGTRMDETKVLILYHGVSMVYFDQFTTTFSSPTSTTTKLQVATIFARNDGIILELKMHRSELVQHPKLRYFNCSFISCFASEDERLFVNPPYSYSLEFHSIRNMVTDENYQHYINAINVLDNITNGKRPTNTSTKCVLTIYHLLSHSCYNKNEINYPNYILKCFTKWAISKTEQIKVDVSLFQNSLYEKIAKILFFTPKKQILKFYRSTTVSNLLAFGVINIIFKNIQHISCVGTGTISAEYLSSLLSILDCINKLEFSKLNKLYLWDVSNIASLEMFKPSFVEKGWKLQSKENYLAIFRLKGSGYACNAVNGFIQSKTNTDSIQALF
eukprot:62028_1